MIGPKIAGPCIPNDQKNTIKNTVNKPPNKLFPTNTDFSGAIKYVIVVFTSNFKP